MATISAATNEKVYSIPKWLGLNEHPDGDTRLKIGEAAKMVNWKITRDGNLKRRPGTEFIVGLADSYVVSRSNVLTMLGTYKASDKFTVYEQASASAVPGKITVTTGEGTVNRGVHVGPYATVEDGIADYDSSVWIVDKGVLLGAGNAEIYTMEELLAAVGELAFGSYLYYVADELTYAIDATCIFVDNYGNYTLGGYLVQAVPTVGTDSEIKAMWAGVVAGKDCFLVACQDGLWSIWDADNNTFTDDGYIGVCKTDKGFGFFPFDGKVYILNGYDYYCYDGTNLTTVDGYRPLITIAIGPLDTDTDGDTVNDTASYAGELTGEYVNRLNGKRRVWLSGDGTNKVFRLPEKAHSIDWVHSTTDGSNVAYSFTPDTDTITITTTPIKAVNSIEVAYSIANWNVAPAGIPYYRDTALTDLAGNMPSAREVVRVDSVISSWTTGGTPSYTYYVRQSDCECLRNQVTGNLYAELYSGTTDTRVFIYGDGTNRALYSGMDYDGMPRADYFPDLYEVHIGDANTPITGMIRHYSTLVAYKPNECWSLQHGIVELATNDLTPAVYCIPVNKDRGNIAPGQVRLVENNPITCTGTELYQWINSSYYSSNLTRDERQAKRISDRIQESIKEFDFKTACMWDDNDHQEFYICQNKVALVWNYAADAWYRYENFDAAQICNFKGELYIGTSEGKIMRVSEYVNGDDGRKINAVWESGAMDFGADYMRKYSSMMWVGLKPAKGTSVDITLKTDRKDTFLTKTVSSEKAKVSGEPFMVKTKLKAKKFEYYRLILSVTKKMPAVTVTNVDFRVRQTGYAK